MRFSSLMGIPSCFFWYCKSDLSFYFCGTRNIIEIWIIELYFQINFCRDFEYLLKNLDNLFDSEW